MGLLVNWVDVASHDKIINSISPPIFIARSSWNSITNFSNCQTSLALRFSLRRTSPCLAVHQTVQSCSLSFRNFGRHRQHYRFVAQHYITLSLNLILAVHIHGSEGHLLLSLNQCHDYVQSLFLRFLELGSTRQFATSGDLTAMQSPP
jgi:hypothetical protein